MTLTHEQLASRLQLDSYPRAAGYESEWVLENMMGPNVLWLAEALSQVMEWQPGMRVLDMGCGKAVSSIFLAKEFGVEVWANDLWIGAAENWKRIAAAGMQGQVFPVKAEAHALPYAQGFFDALVSFDAYHYFGTDDLYIGYYSQFVRPGGQIGIVVPGLRHELAEGPPEHLVPYWEWDFCSFHSPEWWRHHWDITTKVEVLSADWIEDGWRQWLLWEEVCRDAGYPFSESEIAMLQADQGRYLGFTRLLARRPD